ncbi:MAG: hypothetical protein C4525_00660 [Desulfarculus sp.]|nr:MAG: hypothetical protein C4525_00660 [Desulfarculus sp.]
MSPERDLPPEPNQEPDRDDPERRQKLANEAWLQARYKIVAPLLILAMLAVFILPLLFLSFLEALVIQIAGAGALYLLGKKFTTAFDRRRIF